MEIVEEAKSKGIKYLVHFTGKSQYNLCTKIT